MSKQSEERAKRGYREKPDTCGNCAMMAANCGLLAA